MSTGCVLGSEVDAKVKDEEVNGSKEVGPATEPPGKVFLLKPGRKQSYSSALLTPDDLTNEILARAEKKRQNFPDGVDVLMAMKSPSQVRLPAMELLNVPLPAPQPKMPKLRDDNKPSLDATELLSILEDGAEGHYVERQKPIPKRAPAAKIKEPLDSDLEKELALKQLMEFSNKRGRRRESPKENNNNNNSKLNDKDKPKKKEVKKGNRELQKLLQDEGAINMLYDIEKGESETKERQLSSKRRLKKVLKRKAQEVEEAILEATSSSGNSPRLRTQERSRKPSIDSTESEMEGSDFTFASPGEASKIIRRHSSSSSYSSRGSSPRRMSLDFDSFPPTPTKPGDSPPKKAKISERAEKLIEMKCRELNLQPEHSDMIKKLIRDKKNGFKERLQTEFTNKFKAAINSPVSKNDSAAKAVWQMVVEDWDTGDELSDSETKKPPEMKEEPPKSNQFTATASAIKANLCAVLRNSLQNSVKKSNLCPYFETTVPIPASIPRPKPGPNPGSEVRVERHGTVVKIHITPTTSHLVQALNAKVMTDLCKALEQLEMSSDEETRVIVLSCPSSSRATNVSDAPWVYCNGVDLPSLLDEQPDSRRATAIKTANALKNLVTKLAMVGRPILTAVSGQAVGFGVVLLAYCDYVLADDTATFFTPYGRLGYLPEGAATLVLPQLMGQRRAAALLVGATKLSATQAEMSGLVTELVPGNCLEARVMELAHQMSTHSLQSTKSTKALLMHSIRTRLPVVLSTEVKLLEQHWSSEECQTRIKDMVANPIF